MPDDIGEGRGALGERTTRAKPIESPPTIMPARARPPKVRPALRTVAFLGNHAPRQCGIATFTLDLSGAIQTLNPTLDCMVIAVNDAGKHYPYPEQVRYQIPEQCLSAYHRAADYLNESAVDLLSVQHEYGIFGGQAGAHLLPMLRRLHMPVVTTLHTVIADPSPPQRAVMDELCAPSAQLVVMSNSSADLLRRVHHVPSSKIQMIHHGAPRLPDRAESKASLGTNGRQVLLTFGLLSPDKGIEYVIDALAVIKERCPEVLYIVLGATHPHVKAQHGERYRHMLEERALSLGVEQHVRFVDRFMRQDELLHFLAAADVYVTPYLNPEQSTSGTLAYAIGAGKAVVSTPYHYAKEILADGRGCLVRARSGKALAAAVSQLLQDDQAKADLERRALSFGAAMLWPAVAERYLDCFESACAVRPQRPPSGPAAASPVPRTPPCLPDFNLGHLSVMTDDTGMLQHAVHAVPRYEDGYCLDDNARALLVMAGIARGRARRSERVHALSTRYLAFVRHAFDPDSGRFRNFMSYARRWTETVGSEDSHGRALWALGTAGVHTLDPGCGAVAMELFERALPAVASFTSPRAWAYALLGVAEYVQARGPDGSAGELGKELATRLMDQFAESSKSGWPWCEDRLTYSNARLPQALMASSVWMGDGAMQATGLQSLDWLVAIQTTDAGVFAPIGSNGFFLRGGSRAEFDQQPVEACGAVAACLLGYQLTDDARWQARAQRAFNWFLGHNQLNEWVYDPATGGCRDGLHRDRRNENQGAESTLSFLMALLDMRQNAARAEARCPLPSTCRPGAARATTP